MGKEIERKFILTELPQKIKYKSKTHIKQGYLSISDNKEIRVRQKGRYFYQTIKSGSGLIREETEISLTHKQFQELWSCTSGYRIEKTRYEYTYKKLLLEIDEYNGPLDGLFTGEVEFSCKESSSKFKKPDFFQYELTFDPRYKNQTLASLGSIKKSNLKKIEDKDLIIGTLPYFYDNSDIKVVLITNRKGTQWIFPKGHPEENIENKDIALQEANEEAGVRGYISNTPVILPYRKGEEISNMLAYPIEINKIQKDWIECNERQRKIVSIKEAYLLSDQQAVHCGLKYLESFI